MEQLVGMGPVMGLDLGWSRMGSWLELGLGRTRLEQALESWLYGQLSSQRQNSFPEHVRQANGREFQWEAP